jgi:hypothetical protein
MSGRAQQSVIGAAFAPIFAVALALPLASCASDRASAPVAAAESPPISAVRSAPPENLAGRWMLAAAGSSQCNMNFGAQPNASEGTIAPEGGCPGNFFTSRKWTFEGGSLVIRDHNGEPLGRLAHAATSRFEGKATAGAQVTLSR